MATYELEWVGESGKDGGLRWENQPEFYPVGDKRSAYLLGHDLLEHFDMLDYSIEGELFAVGAMIRTRLEGYYFQHLRSAELNGKSNEDILIEAVQSELMQITDDLNAGGDPEHLGSDSYWMHKARQCKIQNKDVDELIEESFAQAYFKGLIRSDLSDANIAKLHSDAKSIVRLGYSMAKRQYRKYDAEQLAMTYKSITKATMKVLSDYDDLLYPDMKIELKTYPAIGKTVISLPMERFNDWDEMRVVKENVSAFFYDNI